MSGASSQAHLMICAMTVDCTKSVVAPFSLLYHPTYSLHKGFATFVVGANIDSFSFLYCWEGQKINWYYCFILWIVFLLILLGTYENAGYDNIKYSRTM